MKKYLIGAAVFVLLIVGVLVIKSQGNDNSAVVVPTKGSYVALGDSVAAGVGLKTDSDASACNRTNQAYPNQAADALHYKLTNLACSGATLLAGITGQQEVNKLMVKPQLDQLFALPKPDLITLTIGANDADWTTVFAKCYTGTCGSPADTTAVKQSLATVSANLQKALAQIQQQYGLTPTSKAPKVLVTGYHQVFPTAAVADCGDLAGVDAAELAWARQQQTAINDTIQAAVKTTASVKYVPVDFSGHELCTTNPWIQGLGDKQPYHPTEAGQAAFAKQIEANK